MNRSAAAVYGQYRDFCYGTLKYQTIRCNIDTGLEVCNKYRSLNCFVTVSSDTDSS